MLLMFTRSSAFLQINQLPDNNGYIDIKVDDVEIVNTTNTIVHIINVGKILETLNLIETNIKALDVSNKQVLLSEIESIYEKVQTIIPRVKRNRRGLLNVVGKAQKWLFGTMDDEDRTDILEHLSATDENNRNLIKTVNRQIIVNDSFNKSINSLRDSIEKDRINIKSAFQEIRKSNNEIVKRLLYLDQLSKLKVIEDKIEKIQDNIASAKNNFVHPSIFTRQEIELFKIDFYKLKLLRIGVMSFSEDSIIVAVQIPDEIIVTQLRSLVPMPNKNHLEIDEYNVNIVEINNIVLEYKENTILRHLKPSKHCSLTGSCKYKFNNKTNIVCLDDETILLKNVRNEKLGQTCDNRNLSLSGNYLINFNNCNLTIFNQTFKNNKNVIYEKFFYPPDKIANLTHNEIKFEKIMLEHTKNIDEIKELRFHNKIVYGLNSTVIILVIIISIIIYTLKRREKTNLKLKLNETKNITVLNTEDIIKKYRVDNVSKSGVKEHAEL